MGIRISRDVAARILRDGDAIDPGRPLTLTDLRFARELAARLDSGAGDEPLSAGRLSAAVELAGVLRRRLEEYFERTPELAARLLGELAERLTEDGVRAALDALSAAVLEKREAPRLSTAAGALPAATGSDDDLRSVLVEAILVWALDTNPAAAPVCRRLQGSALRASSAWTRLLEELPEVLDRAPPLDPRSPSLGGSLRAPVLAAPESLAEQVRYLLNEWRELEAGERAALTGSLDLISEEEAPRFPPGPGPVELPVYDGFEDEPPNYSSDLHWMEPLVLIAKNSYVWLDQLSREHGREIERLDQIPDRELARLAERGVSGLWLIGIWERSEASARIKQLRGDADALASAYSLRDYEIAAELGGAGAVAELAERAAEHGIRLAADMVPNHMGIDSRWVIEHPERFLAAARCPFPAYTFDGPDLSSDPRVGIYLEDHYYDRTDAAVVFKRVDRTTGEERYVYHGNDGTSTPWNDTAQLDYLNPETRAAVVRTILRVAESFPIIRFDAAMTLARRHVQRLWFPEPGKGGAIPSRSQHALTREEFRRAMPDEFWREVVDRVAEERPDTLLLAEAFWLMESYFVRSLGMHRVYNSAFMNLLRDGETAKLGRMIRETLAFDPEILKRYVNFLSNPDEDSAIEQFGAGDRYFGACVVLATLPGLPMVAHGQFEGYREKYGMEFRRARLGEETDTAILDRHRREIFPLLRRRARFAGVEDFRLLDLVDERGAPAVNVLAYANGRDAERSIVLFNNSPDRVAGTLPGVASFLAELEPATVYRFRDRTSGLYFLARADELAERGLAADLGPYESRVLIDFRPVLRTVQESYAALAEQLGGRGVRNVKLELELLEWRPLIAALAAWLEPGAPAVNGAPGSEAERPGSPTVEPAAQDLRRIEERALAHWPRLDRRALAAGLARVPASAGLRAAVEGLPWPASRRMEDVRRQAAGRLESSLDLWRALLGVRAVRAAIDDELDAELWSRVLEELTGGAGFGSDPDPSSLPVLGLALEEDWLAPVEAPGRAGLAAVLERWLARPDGARLVGLNRYEGQEWVRKEELELLLEWRGLTALCGWLMSGRPDDEAAVAGLAWLDSVGLLRRLFERAGYAVDPVRDRLRGRR